jgi:GR25 family glycosyltransferase involved in LPS biosynthesis
MTLNIPSYIITMQGESVSETLSQECAKSAEQFGINTVIFPATHGKDINVQWHKHNLKDFKFNQRIKKINPGMVGCLISHLSLWKKCIEIQKPILIFEHDALMIREIPHSILDKFKDVCNLDWLSRRTTNYDEEVKIDRGPGVKLYMEKRPPYSGLELYNKSHIKGAHSYIVKPQGAQKLVDFVWSAGALAPDVIINSISCLLTYSETSYCRINPRFWNPSRMKAKNSFCRPNNKDKIVMKEGKNV